MAWERRCARLKEVERGTKMSQATTDIHSGRKGDVVVVSGHRVGDRERVGEIVEVFGEPGHARYRVRWDDGGESVFTPGSDASIRPARRPASRRRSS
jgi:hypothetical protein